MQILVIGLHRFQLRSFPERQSMFLKSRFSMYMQIFNLNNPPKSITIMSPTGSLTGFILYNCIYLRNFKCKLIWSFSINFS